jgi:hypothetical protein
MASEVKRWEMYGDTYGGVEIAPMPNGDWVKHEDHDRAIAEKDRVIAKLREQRNWGLKFDVRFKDEQELYEAILRVDAEIEAIERGEP